MVRVARPTSNGCPASPNTTGITVASQASIRSDAGDRVPPKSRHAARARRSRSANPTTTLICGRRPPHDDTAAVSAWSSTQPQASANASAWR
jgi:hypothetical protein